MREQTRKLGARRVVAVGTPGTKRMRMFASAAARRSGAAVRDVSYEAVLSGRADLAADAGSAVFRLDSPAGCEVFALRCLREGEEEAEAAGLAVERPSGDAARGEVRSPAQWFFGFRRCLGRLAERLPGACWMTPPAEAAAMFDKAAVAARWRAAGVPTVPVLGQPAGYEQVRGLLRDHPRLFIKHRYGSSATGAVAIHRQGGRVRGLASTTLDGGRLFLSKRVCPITSEGELRALVDRLGGQGLVAQPWLPKAKLLGRNVDVRAVTVGGRLSHAVGRSSGSPMTNLNLDASRLSAEVLRLKLGEDVWAGLREIAAAAAGVLDALAVGLDVLVRPGGELLALEANAFGDYLLRLTWEDVGTHEAQVDEMVRRGLLAGGRG